jgi:hypothetical protein
MSLQNFFSVPFGLITIGDEETVEIFTSPAASLLLETAAASAKEIFSIIADLCRPVLAFLAPAFWTKNTSSVSFDLSSLELTLRFPL